MRKFLSVLLLIILIICPISSKENKLYVAIIPIESDEVSDSDAATLTKMFETQIAKTRSVKLIERTEINSILKEQSFSLSDFADKDSALAFGKLVSARYLICPTVNKFLSKYLIAVNVFDAESGEKLWGIDDEAKDDAELKTKFEKIAKKVSLYFSENYLNTFDFSASVMIRDGEVFSTGITFGCTQQIFKNISLGFYITPFYNFPKATYYCFGGGRLTIGDPRSFAGCINIGPFYGIGLYFKSFYIGFEPIFLSGYSDTFSISLGYSAIL